MRLFEKILRNATDSIVIAVDEMPDETWKYLIGHLVRDLVRFLVVMPKYSMRGRVRQANFDPTRGVTSCY